MFGKQLVRMPCSGGVAEYVPTLCFPFQSLSSKVMADRIFELCHDLNRTSLRGPVPILPTAGGAPRLLSILTQSGIRAQLYPKDWLTFLQVIGPERC